MMHSSFLPARSLVNDPIKQRPCDCHQQYTGMPNTRSESELLVDLYANRTDSDGKMRARAAKLLIEQVNLVRYTSFPPSH